MEGYTLSDKGKESIKKYAQRRVMANVFACFATLAITFSVWFLLRGHMPFWMELVIIWVTCVLVILGTRILFIKVLNVEYGDILTRECDPYLFLEIHNGMMRMTNDSRKANNLNMLCTAEAYLNMGKYEDAAYCISNRYIQVSTLNKWEYIIYLNQQFRCYYGMGKWNLMRERFATFKAAVEDFQESTRSPKMIVRSEKIYERIRVMMMNYEILTIEGAYFISSLISDIQNRLEETLPASEIALNYYELGLKELAREDYVAAENAFNQVVKTGNRLWITELARKQTRMIHERDMDIALVKESELAGIRAMINVHNTTSKEVVTEMDLRQNIIYVLHQDGEVAGIARITNEMQLGQIVFQPQYDNSKNQFRLLQEMKRRGYVKEETKFDM